MFNQPYNINKDVLYKGILERLRNSVNHLDLSFCEGRKYIPEFFCAVREFSEANSIAIKSRLNELESPYFGEYHDCIDRIEELIKTEFGEDWKMVGEW